MWSKVIQLVSEEPSFEARWADSKPYNPNCSSNTALETSDCSSRLSFVQAEKLNSPHPHF